MKVRFIKRHVIAGQRREDDVVYEEGQVVDFKSWVEETYARKYVDLGDAVEVDEKAERKAAAEAKAKEDADAKTKAEADAKAKSDADAKAKSDAAARSRQGGGQSQT